MMSPQHTSQVFETAALWHVRRRGPVWTTQDEQALAAWLQQDNQHQVAFARVGQTWQDFSHIPRPRIAPDVRSLSVPQQSAQPAHLVQPVACPHPRRRAQRMVAWFSGWMPALRRFRLLRPPAVGAGVGVGVAFSLVLALVIGGGYAWHGMPSDSARWTTAAHERRALTLPDGSHVALNIDTSLRMRFYPDRRDIALLHGEAFFDVAADPQRPFIVTTGTTQIRVTGTAFNVQAAPPRIVVKVREGQVHVSTDGTRPDTVLHATQGLAIDPDTGDREVLRVLPDTVGNWRSGALTLQNMSLAELGAELSRYVGGPVELDGVALPGMRVSGLVNLAAPEVFIESLPDLLPVVVVPLPGGGYRITPR